MGETEIETGGGILVYVRDDIPSEEINNIDIGVGTEGIFVELNFRKSKWLLLAVYRPPYFSNVNCVDNISDALDFYSVRKSYCDGRSQHIRN